MIESLLLNLQRHDVLTDEERETLKAILHRGRRFSAAEDIVSEGSRPGYSSLLIDGFAARYKLTAEGTRQITAIHIAGDFVDLHAFLLKTMDHGVIALSNCQIALAEHPDLKLITERQPHLARMLWLDTLVHGSIHRAWIVAMGRRSKVSHLAHIICELYVRLTAVRRTHERSFYLPLSQGEMADVLGLSLVHMNRVIQALRREGLISWINQTITVLDWEGLVEMAEFDPTYLSLRVEPR
ncbi:Crp/Fnr family transcriptional regulator [Rhizobium terrae]|uniref:Crp/Fnr family transcriptional regulator n=1 Tax=Rhizobium terrae TaxID=2171756 RepID=UPI000E3C1AE0|nr:Crp/Fnr family transcriptional regulator [Rhizobium terrae]